MADEIEKQEGENEEPKKKKQGLSLVMIIGLIVGFLVVQVAAIYIIFTMFIAPSGNAEADKGKEKNKTEQHGEHAEGNAQDGEGDAHASGNAQQDEDMPADGYKIRKVGEIIPIKCGGKDEIILNPRGSSSRYVIVSVGLEMRPSAHAEGEEESGHGDGHGGGGDAEDPLMVPICDKIISVISSKTLDELQLPNMRDSLRTLLRNELQPYYGEKRIRTVYFPRFIIQ